MVSSASGSDSTYASYGSATSGSAGSSYSNHGRLDDCDYVCVLDGSRSMGKEDAKFPVKGKLHEMVSRWKASKMFVEVMAEYIIRMGYDPDGVDLYSFNKKLSKGRNVKDMSGINRALKKVKLKSGSRMSLAIDKISQIHQKKIKGGSIRPTRVILVTDGAPRDARGKTKGGQREVEKSIKKMMKKARDHMDISISIIGVGQEKGTSRFLEHLDSELSGPDGVDYKSVDDVLELIKLQKQGKSDQAAVDEALRQIILLGIYD